MLKNINRRNFIKRALIGLVSIEVGYLLFDMFRNKSDEDTSGDWFSAGRLNTFEQNKLYPFGSANFYLSVMDDGGLLALSIKCTHLGCIIQPDDTGFQCPCHASSFNKLGEVLSPPATRSLDVFPIKIVQGEVFVDVNHPMKRAAFDQSQIT